MLHERMFTEYPEKEDGYKKCHDEAEFLATTAIGLLEKGELGVAKENYRLLFNDRKKLIILRSFTVSKDGKLDMDSLIRALAKSIYNLGDKVPVVFCKMDEKDKDKSKKKETDRVLIAYECDANNMNIIILV